jgi:putative tricarboxylic transport membrane protein
METLKKREIAVGAFFLVLGLVFLFLTSAIPRRQFIDAAFIPYVLAITMCILGVLQLREAFKLPNEEPDAAQDKADYRTVWKTLALVVAYAALLKPIGFPLMTIVYLFLQFVVLSPEDKKINYALYGLIAVVTSVSVYATFRYAFDMILPVGLLGNLLV